MEDLFKKFVYTGVGLVSMTVDKFQQSVDKLVDDDKISQDEGRKIIDDLLKNTEAKREEFEGKLKNIVEEAMVKMNFATQTQLKEMQDQIAELQAKVGIEKKEEEAEVEEKTATTSKKKAPVKKAENATA